MPATRPARAATDTWIPRRSADNPSSCGSLSPRVVAQRRGVVGDRGQLPAHVAEGAADPGMNGRCPRMLTSIASASSLGCRRCRQAGERYRRARWQRRRATPWWIRAPLRCCPGAGSPRTARTRSRADSTPDCCSVSCIDAQPPRQAMAMPVVRTRPITPNPISTVPSRRPRSPSIMLVVVSESSVVRIARSAGSA